MSSSSGIGSPRAYTNVPHRGIHKYDLGSPAQPGVAVPRAKGAGESQVHGTRSAHGVSRRYDQEVQSLAEANLGSGSYSAGMCGRRLVAVLCRQLSVLGKFGELSLELQVRAKLRGISVASPARPLLRAHLVPALGDLTGCGSFPSDVDCRRTSPRRSSEPPSGGAAALAPIGRGRGSTWCPRPVRFCAMTETLRHSGAPLMTLAAAAAATDA